MDELDEELFGNSLNCRDDYTSGAEPPLHSTLRQSAADCSQPFTRQIQGVKSTYNTSSQQIAPFISAAAASNLTERYSGSQAQAHTRGGVLCAVENGWDREAFGRPHHRPLPHLSNSANDFTAVQASSNTLVSLDAALPPEYRRALPYGSLNRIQSRVFDVVFNSDVNVAVAAPTGCGKTAIFELAIVRLQMRNDGFLCPREAHASSRGVGNVTAVATCGKVVYLAPLKALCLERQADWVRKFGPCASTVSEQMKMHASGIRCSTTARPLKVVCITGDDMASTTEEEVHDLRGSSSNSNQEVPDDPPPSSTWSSSAQDSMRTADIVITTPEKWDSLTRRWKDNAGLVGSVALLCVDEVHTIADGTRGAVLEAVITRMRMLSTSPTIVRRGWPVAALRIVAVSATLPNLTDIGRWIGAPRHACLSFGDEFRPVPLATTVIGYEVRGSGRGSGPSNSEGGGSSSSGGFLFEKYLETRVFEVVEAYSNGGRPALIFCASRNGVRSTAERLVTDSRSATTRPASAASGRGAAVFNSGIRGATFSIFLRDAHHALRCAEASAAAKDARLAACLRAGVGFHSAGETPSDRALVEALFRSGDLPVLATTSTLAMGVNLPAHLVVIKSTSAWRGPGIGYAEYNRSILLQMIGRAGRPQFDTTGAAVIMTSSDRATNYRNLVGGLECVESSMGDSLVEHLAAEIVLRTIDTVGAANAWLQTTFLAVRCAANPVHYGANALKRPVLEPAADKGADGNELSDTQMVAAVEDVVNAHLAHLVADQLFALYQVGCVRFTATPSAVRRAEAVDGTVVGRTATNAASMRQISLMGTTLDVDAEAVAQGQAESPFHPSSASALKIAGPSVSVHALDPAAVLSRHYLRFPTMALFPLMPREATVETLLPALCHAREIVDALVLRRDDRKGLREVKEVLGRVKTARRGTPAGKITDVPDKAFQLLQVALGRVRLEPPLLAAGSSSFGLRMEIHTVVDLMQRITSAFVAFCVSPSVKSPLAVIGVQANRSIRQTLWHDPAPGTALLQLRGVTEAMLPQLHAIGISSIEELTLAGVTGSGIEAAVRRAHPFGARLIEQALSFAPELSLHGSNAVTQAKTEAGVAVLSIEVSVKTAKSAISKLAGSAGSNTPAQRSILQFLSNTGHKKHKAKQASTAAGDADNASVGTAGVVSNVALATLQSRTGLTKRGDYRDAATGLGGGGNSYILAVTTADPVNGLVLYTPNITVPGRFTVRVPRPTAGPVVQVHLLHAVLHGRDSRVTFRPTYGFGPVPPGLSSSENCGALMRSFLRGSSVATNVSKTSAPVALHSRHVKEADVSVSGEDQQVFALASGNTIAIPSTPEDDAAVSSAARRTRGAAEIAAVANLNAIAERDLGIVRTNEVTNVISIAASSILQATKDTSAKCEPVQPPNPTCTKHKLFTVATRSTQLQHAPGPLQGAAVESASSALKENGDPLLALLGATEYVAFMSEVSASATTSGPPSDTMGTLKPTHEEPETISTRADVALMDLPLLGGNPQRRADAVNLVPCSDATPARPTLHIASTSLADTLPTEAQRCTRKRHDDSTRVPQGGNLRASAAGGSQLDITDCCDSQNSVEIDAKRKCPGPLLQKSSEDSIRDDDYAGHINVKDCVESSARASRQSAVMRLLGPDFYDESAEDVNDSKALTLTEIQEPTSQSTIPANPPAEPREPDPVTESEFHLTSTRTPRTASADATFETIPELHKPLPAADAAPATRGVQVNSGTKGRELLPMHKTGICVDKMLLAPSGFETGSQAISAVAAVLTDIRHRQHRRNSGCLENPTRSADNREAAFKVAQDVEDQYGSSHVLVTSARKRNAAASIVDRLATGSGRRLQCSSSSRDANAPTTASSRCGGGKTRTKSRSELVGKNVTAGPALACDEMAVALSGWDDYQPTGDIILTQRSARGPDNSDEVAHALAQITTVHGSPPLLNHEVSELTPPTIQAPVDEDVGRPILSQWSHQKHDVTPLQHTGITQTGTRNVHVVDQQSITLKNTATEWTMQSPSGGQQKKQASRVVSNDALKAMLAATPATRRPGTQVAIFTSSAGHSRSNERGNLDLELLDTWTASTSNDRPRVTSRDAFSCGLGNVPFMANLDDLSDSELLAIDDSTVLAKKRVLQGSIHIEPAQLQADEPLKTGANVVLPPLHHELRPDASGMGTTNFVVQNDESTRSHVTHAATPHKHNAGSSNDAPLTVQAASHAGALLSDRVDARDRNMLYGSEARVQVGRQATTAPNCMLQASNHARNATWANTQVTRSGLPHQLPRSAIKTAVTLTPVQAHIDSLLSNFNANTAVSRLSVEAGVGLANALHQNAGWGPNAPSTAYALSHAQPSRDSQRLNALVGSAAAATGASTASHRSTIYGGIQTTGSRSGLRIANSDFFSGTAVHAIPRPQVNTGAVTNAACVITPAGARTPPPGIRTAQVSLSEHTSIATRAVASFMDDLLHPKPYMTPTRAQCANDHELPDKPHNVFALKANDDIISRSTTGGLISCVDHQRVGDFSAPHMNNITATAGRTGTHATQVRAHQSNAAEATRQHTNISQHQIDSIAALITAQQETTRQIMRVWAQSQSLHTREQEESQHVPELQSQYAPLLASVAVSQQLPHLPSVSAINTKPQAQLECTDAPRECVTPGSVPLATASRRLHEQATWRQNVLVQARTPVGSATERDRRHVDANVQTLFQANSGASEHVHEDLCEIASVVANLSPVNAAPPSRRDPRPLYNQENGSGVIRTSRGEVNDATKFSFTERIARTSVQQSTETQLEGTLDFKLEDIAVDLDSSLF